MPELPRPPRAAPMSFQLRDIRVEPDSGSIVGPAGHVHLEPRVMAVLVMLASQANELVTRQTLLESIWTGGKVYDEALTQCIYQLRQQLISAGGNDYRDLITTVPKRGYRLNCSMPAAEPAPADETPAMVESPRRRPAVRALAALLLLAAIGLSIVWLYRSAAPELAAQPHAIAVLPFLPLAEEQREPVLELGMADTLITRLSGIRNLVVRPVTAVRRYGELERNPLQAGRELGVESVVDASIQRSGETVRVTARLLQVADGKTLWAESFDTPFSDIFAVQDDICERISEALSLHLGPQERISLVQGGTSSTDAYERYLKGRYHLAQLTPPDMLASVGYFEEAVALDPEYALAWLGLAKAQFRIPIAGEVPPKAYYPNARLAAEKALEIDPALAEGYAILGWIAHWFEWDWAGSEAYFEQAMEFDGNDTESHLGYAQLLADTGRVGQALAEVRRARELSPSYLVAAALEGGFMARAGQAEEAVSRLQEAQRLDEKFWLTHVALAGVYSGLGRHEEALAETRLARQYSGSTWAMAMETGALVRAGLRPEAESLVAEMLQRSEQRYVPPYDLAVAFNALGDSDAALTWLLRAHDARDPKMALLGTDPGWLRLQDRPEFTELMRQMNFPEPAE
jgi:TolB-like protein/DNA-binding winged helix-turn-helix (wHTH) protein/Tfp pilus assembly protein PilF